MKYGGGCHMCFDQPLIEISPLGHFRSQKHAERNVMKQKQLFLFHHVPFRF